MNVFNIRLLQTFSFLFVHFAFLHLQFLPHLEPCFMQAQPCLHIPLHPQYTCGAPSSSKSQFEQGLIQIIFSSSHLCTVDKKDDDLKFFTEVQHSSDVQTPCFIKTK